MRKILFNIYILTVISILGMTVSAYSQNLFLVGMDQITKTADISTDWEIQVIPTIKNTSIEDIVVRVRIEALEIPNGHSFGACWAGGCLAGTILNWDSPTSVVLKGGSEMPEFTFVGHYYCNFQAGPCTPGTAKFRYTFLNDKNSDDKAVLNATLSFTGEVGIVESLSLPELNVEYLKNNILNFTTKEIGSNYKCSIYSTNGNVVKTISFSETTSIPLIELSSGCFVYSVINHKGLEVAKGKFLKD